MSAENNILGLHGTCCPNKNCDGKLQNNTFATVTCNNCGQVVQSQNHWQALCRLSAFNHDSLLVNLENVGY